MLNLRRTLIRPFSYAVVAAACLVATGSALAGDLTISSTTTTTMPATNPCVITFRLTSAVELSNIDFEVNYALADGEFNGEFQNVFCAASFGGGLFAKRDLENPRIIDVARARVDNFDGPVNLMSCSFTFFDDPPVKGDFQVTVTNAARIVGLDTVDVVPLPKVKIDVIECPGVYPPTTTTTLPQTTTSTTTSTSSTTTFFSSSTTTLLPSGNCATPISGGDKPTASDALFILQAGVGLRACAECLCDADGNGDIVASDALVALRASVDQPVELDCPPCGS